MQIDASQISFPLLSRTERTTTVPPVPRVAARDTSDTRTTQQSEPNANSNTDGDTFTRSAGPEQLSAEDQKKVDELKARDQEVRTHEQAHVAAAGPLFRGGPYYEYEKGPDGASYAVAGRVSIDTGPGRTPEETITKAQRIRRAALAPAEPSSVDRSVANQASQMEAQARRELAEAQTSEESQSAAIDALGASRDTRTKEPTQSGRLLDVLA